MNEQTDKLIRELADKLGTTADHLWEVLIHQAPISATIGILGDGLILYALYVGWKRLLRIDFEHWDSDMGKGVMFGLMFCVTAVALIGALVALPVEISGLLNPEYWALKQLWK